MNEWMNNNSMENKIIFLIPLADIFIAFSKKHSILINFTKDLSYSISNKCILIWMFGYLYCKARQQILCKKCSQLSEQNEQNIYFHATKMSTIST